MSAPYDGLHRRRDTGHALFSGVDLRKLVSRCVWSRFYEGKTPRVILRYFYLLRQLVCKLGLFHTKKNKNNFKNRLSGPLIACLYLVQYRFEKSLRKEKSTEARQECLKKNKNKKTARSMETAKWRSSFWPGHATIRNEISRFLPFFRFSNSAFVSSTGPGGIETFPD